MSRYAWVFVGVLLVCLGARSAKAQFSACPSDGQSIGYGDTIEGEFKDGQEIFVNYCFEGHTGDEIALHIDLVDGEDVVAMVSDLTLSYMESFSTADGPIVLEHTLEADSLYVINVSRVYNAKGTTHYTLSLEGTGISGTAEAPAIDLNPEGLTTETGCVPGAYVLIPGAPSEFFIDQRATLQSYCFYAQAGQSYHLIAETLQGDLDPYLLLFSENFESVVSANDNAHDDSTDAGISFMSETDAIYIVSVTRSGLNTGLTEGIFRLSAENLTSRTADACPSVFQLPGEGLFIPAEKQNGLHVFCIEGTKDQTLTLSIEGQNPLSITSYIIDPNWETVADGTTATDSLHVKGKLPADGLYFALVFDNNNTGGFAITLKTP